MLINAIAIDCFLSYVSVYYYKIMLINLDGVFLTRFLKLLLLNTAEILLSNMPTMEIQVLKFVTLLEGAQVLGWEPC